jgi:hypothetical protein
MIFSLYALILASQTAEKDLNRARRCDLICAGVYALVAVGVFGVAEIKPFKGLFYIFFT